MRQVTPQPPPHQLTACPPMSVGLVHQEQIVKSFGDHLQSCRVPKSEREVQVRHRNKLSQGGQLSDAVLELDQFVHRGSYVAKSLFYSVLKRCIGQRDLLLGTHVHALAIRSGYESDSFLANHFICMYGSHGRLEEAWQVFTKVHAPSRFVWASIIFAYARNGQPTEAVRIYWQMRKSPVKPDNHTFMAVLKACASAEDLASGKEVHADILGAADKPDMFVYNCLVDMYAKCGSLHDARKVFDDLPTRDVVTWTAMIAGYAQNGLGQEALALYANMQQEGITPANNVTFVCLLQACASVQALHQGKQLHAQVQRRGWEADVVVGTCLVDMYAKCGSLQDAREVFNQMQTKNVVTWNAMVTGYAKQGLRQESLTLYDCMQKEGTTPADAITFVCLLQVCGSVAGLEKGREIHAHISRSGLEASDLIVASSLIDMYCKCGSMADAKRVFDALPKRDCVTWSALIAGYARQGESTLVFELFDAMRKEGIQPDAVTFLSILSVCNHAGLVAEAQHYFEAMSGQYSIRPTLEHYNCMVDLLGRVGQVDKAMQMVRTMPFQPSIEVWRIVLGACQKWSNVGLAREAFDCAVRLDPNDSSAYALMLNIYEGAHMHEEAKEIQAMRAEVGAWKTPGMSWWTDFGGNGHTFVVGGREHPETQLIYANLEHLFVSMKGGGFVPSLALCFEEY